jgi:peroxiredoxin
MLKIKFPVFLILFSLFFRCTSDKTKDSTLTSVGQKLPDFKIETLTGEKITGQSLTGKVVVLNFFATWCPPCQEELPHLQELWQKYKNDNFYLLSIGREHSRAELDTFIQTKGITFPVAPDQDKSIYKKFATQYIPRTYLIDPNGVIVLQTVGFTISEFQILTNKIDELLNR